MNFSFLVLRRIKREFKHIRIKSSVAQPNVEVAASQEICKIHIQTLANHLSCNNFTARQIVKKNRNILSLSSDDFDINLKFCKHHFKLSDIIEHPRVLSLNSSLLQHRFLSLRELGCNQVSATNILKFHSILKKTPDVLHTEGLSFENRENTLWQYIENSDRAEIVCQLQRMYKDGSTLQMIKQTMNAEYLAAKLGCSIGRAHRIFKSYPPLRVQSISKTDQLLDIFLKQLGFSNFQIFKSLNLLSMHPESVQNFISQVPTLLGIKIGHIINKQPHTLRIPVTAVKEVESILNDFNINEDQLMSCLKIIIFPPYVLRERLTFLCGSRDFSVLKSYKKFLWMVYYFNNLEPRLQAVKELDLSLSLSMFTVSKSAFKKYLSVTECRSHIKDICYYLSNLLNIEEKEISTLLKEYPNHKDSSLLNCQKVVDFLLDVGVTKKQILNGIGIISYDVDVVKVYFNELKNHPECQPFDEWVRHYNLVQLLIYSIEVDTGFQGSRLYKIRRKNKEELLVNCSSN